MTQNRFVVIVRGVEIQITATRKAKKIGRKRKDKNVLIYWRLWLRFMNGNAWPVKLNKESSDIWISISSLCNFTRKMSQFIYKMRKNPQYFVFQFSPLLLGSSFIFRNTIWSFSCCNYEGCFVFRTWPQWNKYG